MSNIFGQIWNLWNTRDQLFIPQNSISMYGQCWWWKSVEFLLISFDICACTHEFLEAIHLSLSLPWCKWLQKAVSYWIEWKTRPCIGQHIWKHELCIKSCLVGLALEQPAVRPCLTIYHLRSDHGKNGRSFFQMLEVTHFCCSTPFVDETRILIPQQRTGSHWSFLLLPHRHVKAS